MKGNISALWRFGRNLRGDILHVQDCAGVSFFALYAPLAGAPLCRRKDYNMMEIYFLNVIALS
jgi:hypothetical protein